MINIKSNGIEGLIEELKNKKLICFGAGKHFDTVMNLYSMYRLSSYCNCIIDNNNDLTKAKRKYCNYFFDIYSLDSIKKIIDKDMHVILVTSHIYSMEIVRQLDEILEFENVDVYIGSFLSDDVSYKGNYCVTSNMQRVIPKIIHYCWFGKGKIPVEYSKYMDSWKEKCPDYIIKKWDESNFDIEQNNYVSQAYYEKKWAFVSDFARIKILYEEGGIYLDCDVELLKNFDVFLGNEFFCGFEDTNHVNFGLGVGAVKGHPLLGALIDMYEKMNFINDDGSINMTPCTAYQTEVVRRYGFAGKNRAQYMNGMMLYPTEVFAPISPWGVGNINESAYSVHHYSASWQNVETMDQIMKMYREYYRRVKRAGE